jgi:hypothetical protein
VVALAARTVTVTATVAATAVTVEACGGGPGVERGFGSRQLLNLRDSTFTFNGSYGNLVYYSTTVEGVSENATSYFSIDAETGQVVSFGSSFPSIVPPTPPRFVCSVTSSSTSTHPALVITDSVSGAQTTIDDYDSSLPGCPMTPDEPLVVWRYDDANHLTLWTGPFAALQQVPLPLLIDQIVAWGTKSTTVLAATADAPGAHGLYGMDMTTFAVTNLVPAATGVVDWATGAAPAGSLMSTSLVVPGILALQPISFFDHYIYSRAMSDGGTTLFAGPYPDGPATELGLFPVTKMIQSIGIYPPPLAVWGGYWPDPAWRVPGGGAGDTLYYWQDASRRLFPCPLPAGSPWMSGMAATDRSRVLFQPANNTGSAITSGPLVMVSFDPAGGGGNCTTLASADVTAAAFSPDGGSMFWLSSPPTGDATLWAAAGDGSAPRPIGTGPIYASYPPHFVSATELELTLGGDLAWVDLRDDPVRMHYVAEQVWGASIDFGDWLIADYDLSGQDGTGRLALVDRTTGDKRLISPEVASFESLGSYPPSPPVQILYLVRGRNPSPQDGIWIATITDTDLQ